jgi:hypothetical protein
MYFAFSLAASELGMELKDTLLFCLCKSHISYCLKK